MSVSSGSVRLPAIRRHLLAAVFLAVAGYALGGAVSASAPAPAAPEKLNWHGDASAPDISGVWVRAETPGSVNGSKEGWLPWPPPLKPAFAKVWHERLAQQAAGTRSDDPVRACLPPGMPRFDTGITTPMLIMQTPGRVTLYRDGMPVRRVWLDGRSTPAAKDIESFSNGNAMGHYEGGGLVTRVVGFKDQPIDATGVPHSDDLVIAERFHRIDADTLQLDVTLTDRTAYTRPIKSVVIYKASDNPMWEPSEFLCTPQKAYHPEAFVH
jgi:hypothetical protein